MKFRKKPVVIEAVQWDGTLVGAKAIMEMHPTMQTIESIPVWMAEAADAPPPAALASLRAQHLEEAAKECDERARIEAAKAQQCRDRKEIAWAQMYEQNADQARLMAQDIRRLAQGEGKGEEG